MYTLSPVDCVKESFKNIRKSRKSSPLWKKKKKKVWIKKKEEMKENKNRKKKMLVKRRKKNKRKTRSYVLSNVKRVLEIMHISHHCEIQEPPSKVDFRHLETEEPNPKPKTSKIRRKM